MNIDIMDVVFSTQYLYIYNYEHFISVIQYIPLVFNILVNACCNGNGNKCIVPARDEHDDGTQ